MLKLRRREIKEAELDITSFMNLMIVLVPVLLLGLVFSQITVLDITLPESAGGDGNPDNQQVELVIRDSGMTVNFPRGIKLKAIPLNEEGEQDFEYLSLVLQQVKRMLKEKAIEKRSITILSEAETSYQNIISAMDTVRSFKAVVAASVVDAELFPEVSFGDAPALREGSSKELPEGLPEAEKALQQQASLGASMNSSGSSLGSSAAGGGQP